MSKPASNCECVVDCHGLHEIACTKSNNLKSHYINALSSGQIGVPAIVWQEFKELYEEEAAELEPHISKKIIMKRAYQVGAARIADKNGSRFFQAPYDSRSDLYAASICSIESYTLLTVASELGSYQKLKCCNALELVSWANGAK